MSDLTCEVNEVHRWMKFEDGIKQSNKHVTIITIECYYNAHIITDKEDYYIYIDGFID